VRIAVECVGLLALPSWESSPRQRELVAVWCCVRWLQALYALRGFEVFGPRMLPILSAVKDTAAFLIVMVFCLLAFTHAFYVIGTRDDGPSRFYAAFLPVFRLGVLGDFDMFELAGDDTVLVHAEDGIWAPEDPDYSDPRTNPAYYSIQIWFFLASVVITVLMMNLLVGILGANYERYEEQSQALFVRARARMIMIISARPWLSCVFSGEELKGCFAVLQAPVLGITSTGTSKDYLYFAMKETPNTDDERSTRRAMQISIEESLKKLSTSFDAKFEKIDKLEAKFEKMEANWDQILKALKEERYTI
jgi:hypothetical protein